MTINCSFALAAAFLGASFVSSPAAEPSSFVLLDQVVTHTGNQQLYENWDFNLGHKTPANAPTNWLAPESPLFDHGIYHWRIEVRRMTAGGGFELQTLDTTIVNPWLKTVGDVDGDGRTDIAYAHMPQGADPDNVRVLFNRGHQDGAQWRDAWEALTLSEAGSHSMRVLDADGDGRPDLFGANWSAEGRDEHVKLWLNRLHTRKRAQALPLDRWGRHVIDEANPWPTAFVGAVDLDGDGWLYVVLGTRWLRNRGRDWQDLRLTDNPATTKD
jgi:hypothetical protein